MKIKYEIKRTCRIGGSLPVEFLDNPQTEICWGNGMSWKTRTSFRRLRFIKDIIMVNGEKLLVISDTMNLCAKEEQFLDWKDAQKI